MSDFDKEAEREKLRKKYEQDQDDREVAEKMSELLLQGATMTNAHCSECGDPIFRYDGQEFCASCERAVDRDAEQSDDGESDEATEDTENIEVTEPSEDTRVKFGSEDATGETGGEQPDQQSAPGQQTSPEQQTAEPSHEQASPPQQTPNPRQQQPRQRSQTEQTREVPGVEPTADGDVSTARDSLVRTLTHFSQQAEATDDPRRAQEYLAAAREAAETLATLRR